MIDSRPPEKCYYCNNAAEYSDIVGEPEAYFVASVCKKHVANYLSA
jgi:hypothetical protein